MSLLFHCYVIENCFSKYNSVKIHIFSTVSLYFVYCLHLVLESEMYQLSHMLTDQKSIISTMLEMSLTSEEGK